MRFTEVPEDLIRQCQSGDEEAFTKLYQLINRDVYASIYYFLRNHDDTDDVMQLVLVRLHKHINRLKDPKKFASWFWRMIVNQCYSYRQKESRAGSDASYNDAIQSAGDDFTAELSNLRNPREVLINKEIMERINEAISLLPKRQRMCFMLFEIEGNSINEIADIMGSSVGAVKFNIHQARQKLREELKDLRKAL